MAEGAFALLIALAKRLPEIGRAMEQEGWIWPESRWLGQDIAGKTLGLVGVGKIGRSMARMAGAGFRARVLGYDPNVDAGTMRAAGVEKVDDLSALLRGSDFVSLHCVLDAATRHLIGAAELAALKPSAILINVSRGALIDEVALVAAVVAGDIAAVGLDVYALEPLSRAGHPMSPLYGRDNVILFPHLTFFTHAAGDAAAGRRYAGALLRGALDGRPVTARSRDPSHRPDARDRAGVKVRIAACERGGSAWGSNRVD